MVSKNNLYLKYEKNSNHQQHFGLRKLSVGVASVLLGTTFYLGSATVVHADTTASNSITEQPMASSATTHNSNPSSSSASTEVADSATNNVDSTAESKESTYVAQSSATETARTPVSSSAVTTPSSDIHSSNASTATLATNSVSSAPNASTPATSAETKSTVNVVGDSAINISVENAHQGDTYKMVLQTDSHNTGTYMAGTFGDNSTVSNKAYIDNSGNQVFEGIFLKDATINQPIQFNFNWNNSMINMPGTYSNPVAVYYNNKLIFNHDFNVVVPNQQAYASWDGSSYTKGIIHPKGVNDDLTYEESRQAYWLIGNDNAKYEYTLNVTPIQKALDHGDTTITIPIPEMFNVDDVSGIANWHNKNKYISQMPRTLTTDDYDWAVSGNNLIINLHHSLQDKFNFDNSIYENAVLTIVGHYTENKNEHGIHVSGLGTATIASFDGKQTHANSFAAISADLLGQNSLNNYTKGQIYSAKIDANYTKNKIEKNGQIYNNVWVIDENNLSDRQAGYTVTLNNASLFDVKDQSFTITLPDGFLASNIRVEPNNIENYFSELTYHYTDGSTSSALSEPSVVTYFDKVKKTMRSKVVTNITGKFNLKNSLDQTRSHVSLTVNGILDPDKTFADSTTLTATLITDGSLHKTDPSVVTITQDNRKVDNNGYISTCDPTNHYAYKTYVTNELNTDLGTITPRYNYSSKLDNITGFLEVTLPKNTSLDYISGGKTYWETPIIDKTADGRIHLFFKLKDNSFTVSHAVSDYENQAVPDKVNADCPVIHFKSTALYVPSLQTDSGTAKLVLNGDVVNQTTFSVSVLSAVAQYLTTGIQGNNDITASLNASSGDKKTGNVKLQYDFVNGTEKSEIEKAVFVGNVSDTQDGQSEFNMHLTGPLIVSDIISQKDLTKNANITYSDKLVDIKNASVNDLSDYVTADAVSDWSKIKSFKISFSTPVMGGHVYQINAPAFVENQVDNVNKTGYLSSIMFGDGLAPFRITAGSPASAKLTIKGQSIIHQKLHYIDENGIEKYIDLPASEDIKLTDLADTFNCPSTLSEVGKRLIPTHYYWDGQLPTIMNSTDVYPDNLPNNLAQNGKLSYYDFDNDSIVWNLLSEPSEKATLTETIHYKYVDNEQQAAPDYVANIPVTIYYDHLTNNIVSVVLPSNLEEVQSPYVDLFNSYYGHFNGYNAGEYSSNNLSKFTNIDLKNHHVTIELTDYYAQSAARLYVVDPNTGFAKTVETTYNLDGSGNINFKTTDDSLKLEGYDMHVYYKQSRALVNVGISYDVNGARLNYPYKTQGGKWNDTTRTVFGQFQDFKGYNSLKDALNGYYDDENVSENHTLNGKYDTLTDMGAMTDVITNKPVFYPSQNFFVFYTPQQNVLKEQLMITADNDPWANSSDKALQLLAIPSTLSDAAKSELYSFIGDARSMLVYNGDGFSSMDRFTINLNKEDYPKLFAELNKLGVSLTPSTSFIGTGTFEMFGRPGYYVDKQSYQITGDDGVTRTYTVNLKPYDDFLKLSDTDKVGKLIYNAVGQNPVKLLKIEYDQDGNLTIDDTTSYSYGNVDGNSIHLSDFTKNDDTHMSLTMYASPDVLSQSNPYPLFDLPLFGMFGIFYDSTLHDENTPDPHPQIINVHYAKMPAVAQSNNNVQINIHYIDVTDLQRNADGQYEFGGGYDNEKKFVNGSAYDLNKVKSYSDLNKFIQKNAQQTPQAMDYTINSDGSLTIKQLINQALTSDLIKLQQKGELADKYQYDMTPFDNAISDDYVIVQASPFATTGKHVIDPNDLDGYKSLSDPTGQNGYFNAMLSLNTQYGTSTQNYYVYLKRKQKINYQVKVEDANGQVLSTLTPSTLLGVGGSNELVSNTIDGTITIGQKYQNIIDSLEKQGYQLVNQSNGKTIASDTLTDLYFDNDQTKDQLVTLYVTQSKQATVHYIDVNNSDKKDNYEPSDGTELTQHAQTIGDLIGSTYTNILWDYASNGYELADPKVPAEATKGEFKFADPSSRDYYVYLKHSYKNISESVTKHETIHYIYKNGKQAAPDYTAQTTFTHTGTQDLTNQNIVWDKWQPGESYTFKAITSPEIKDYQPDLRVVNAQTTTPNDEDIVKTVIYSFTPKHDTVPNDGYDKPTAKLNQETKTFTRTINYRGTKDFGKTYQAVNGAPDGKSSYVQTIKFTRDVLETVDKNGNILATEYGDWKADGTISTVKSADAKNLGYDTVDIENVDGVTVDPNSNQATLDPVTVTYSIDKKHDTIPNDGYDKPTAKLSQETKTFTRTINYRGTKNFGKTYQAVNGAPNGKSSYVQTIKFTRDVLETVDKDGNILSTEYGDWKADGTISTVKSADAKNLGYDTVDIDNVDGITVDPNSNQTTLDPVTVTYSIDKKHDTIPNDGYDKPTAKLSQETKTFTRTINYRGTKNFGKTYQTVNGAPDGKSSYVQTIKFTRDVLETVDKDGNILSTEYGDWKADGTISTVKSADAKNLGYDTVDIDNVDGITVDPNSNQTTLDPVTVTYSINKKHDTIPNDGYDKPTAKLSQETKTFTRTINYRGTKNFGKTYQTVNGAPNGKSSYVQTIKFTRDVLETVDKDGNILSTEYGDWKADGTISTVKSADAKNLGYDTVDIDNVDGITVDPNSNQTTLDPVTVTYSINKKHDTVPNDGYDKPTAKLSQETKTFTRTINYRGTKDFGKTYQAVNGAPDSKSSYVQTIKFTRDVLETVDKNGNILATEYGDWKANGSISAVKSADAKNLGYDTVDIENVNSVTVDPNSNQTTLNPVTVTYSIDKKHDTIPNDGYDKPTVNIKTEHKTYTRTIQYRGTKDGGKTYVSVNGSPDHTDSYIQTIEFTRHIMTSTDTKGNVTILETSPWTAENSTLVSVPSQKVETLGYDEVDVPLIDAHTINPETDDTDLGTIVVTYSINPTIDDTNDHHTPDTDEPKTRTTDTTDRQNSFSTANVPETPTTNTTNDQGDVSSVQTSSTTSRTSVTAIAKDESNNDVSLIKHKKKNSINSDTHKLPQTGSNLGIALTAIGVATTLSALLLAGKKRKRE